MAYIGAGITRFNTADELTVTGDATIDTTTLVVDSTNNRVGIGTSSPSAPLSVSYGGGAVGAQITGNASYAQMQLSAAGANTNAYFTFGANGTGKGIIQRNAVDVITIDSSGNVGIGTSSPAAAFSTGKSLDVNGPVFVRGVINAHQTNAGVLEYSADETRIRSYGATSGSGKIIFSNGGGGSADTERMRIDSSGNLLVGKTSNAFGSVGVRLSSTDNHFTTNGGAVADFNRLTSDGSIVNFYKDGTTVGSIGVDLGWFELDGGSASPVRVIGQSSGYQFASGAFYPQTDNARDLGIASLRWDDIYATNGTIQTSDQNEKQQIASLTDAEITAAKAISKLFKTFKWNDSVAEKGDAARTHTGVIAQEVEQAMTAAGLNAGDYAFFISSDWTDEETGEERNRKGIRYPQLMSFIGAATEQRLASIEARLDALEGA